MEQGIHRRLERVTIYALAEAMDGVQLDRDRD
jgi:hypothetical protein